MIATLAGLFGFVAIGLTIFSLIVTFFAHAKAETIKTVGWALLAIPVFIFYFSVQ